MSILHVEDGKETATWREKCESEDGKDDISWMDKAGMR